MRPESSQTPCANPNIFTDIYENSIAPRLPRDGSLADRALTHTTATRPFFETVSGELCDRGQIGAASAQQAVNFVTRSATSASIVVGTVSLAALGLVVGSPLAALGAGVAGLLILPPLAERFAHRAIRFGGEILNKLGTAMRPGGGS